MGKLGVGKEVVPRGKAMLTRLDRDMLHTDTQKGRTMEKRLWTLPVLAALLIAAGSGGGVAMPSLGGPTGIVSLPNAAIAPTGQLETALSYQSLKLGALDMYEPTTDLTVWSLQALTGFADRAELWGAYSRVRGVDDLNVWGIGGKAQLSAEPRDQTTLAVGGAYQRWDDSSEVGADTDLRSLYIVATKDFTPMGAHPWEWGPGPGTRMLGSLGILYLNAKPKGGSSSSLTRPFVGLQFVDAGGTELGLEYRWKDNDVDQDAVFSAVLRHPVSEFITIEAGTTNAAPGGVGLDKQDIFVRLGYAMPIGLGARR